MYKLINTQTPNGLQLSDYALRLSDGAFVNRENNEEYLKWLAEGNTPLPADEPQQ
jgi:hypothetical protein